MVYIYNFIHIWNINIYSMIRKLNCMMLTYDQEGICILSNDTHKHTHRGKQWCVEDSMYSQV